jgi:uncharacterized delta-60 repeat protein
VRALPAGLLACALVAASVLALAARPAHGASSSVTVTATVPSATNLTASGCASGTAGATSLGIVLPGTSVLSSADCTVVFGSSNDTSMLRAYQLDGTGKAMWRAPTGPLDTTLAGGTGKVVTNMTAGTDSAYVALPQPDGKLVSVGDANGQLGAVRYNADGTLDTAGFGASGKVVLSLGAATSINSAALQPDGKIVVAGAYNNGTSWDCVVARLTSAGALDGTFGTGG